ncbi:MAG: ATP-binding protein [Caldilineaceae bacterium]|nr:ATP-binding protein [Caldilineaceae bacterium]
MPRPVVVVVTGRPGSGKTTLAHRLAKALHCPLLSRDEFKEGYVRTQGRSHTALGAEVNGTIYYIFFKSVDFVVEQGVSVVIEAAFQHRLWERPLLALAEKARVAIVVCAVDPALARRRAIERGMADPKREYFHGDPVTVAARQGIDTPPEEYSPPSLDVPTLTVDTSDGYAPGLADIGEFIASAVGWDRRVQESS